MYDTAYDLTNDSDAPHAPRAPRLGRLASYVKDRRIALEMCPTSNVQTGAVTSLRQHPIDLLRKLSFRVTLNTDNRLLSGVSVTEEACRLADTFGYTVDDLAWFTTNAVSAAFIPYDERRALLRDVIEPGYAALRRQQAGPPDS